MLNKIAEFILDKRFRDLEERIDKMENKLQESAKRICEENRIPPIFETPPIYRYPPRRKLLHFIYSLMTTLFVSKAVDHYLIGMYYNPPREGFSMREV